MMAWQARCRAGPGTGEAEAVLAEREIFFQQPSEQRCARGSAGRGTGAGLSAFSGVWKSRETFSTRHGDQHGSVAFRVGCIQASATASALGKRSQYGLAAQVMSSSRGRSRAQAHFMPRSGGGGNCDGTAVRTPYSCPRRSRVILFSWHRSGRRRLYRSGVFWRTIPLTKKCLADPCCRTPYAMTVP